jgi:hypothetical protein
MHTGTWPGSLLSGQVKTRISKALDPTTEINEEKFKDRTLWRGFVHS